MPDDEKECKNLFLLETTKLLRSRTKTSGINPDDTTKNCECSKNEQIFVGAGIGFPAPEARLGNSNSPTNRRLRRDMKRLGIQNQLRDRRKSMEKSVSLLIINPWGQQEVMPWILPLFKSEGESSREYL
ncbi:MAG: hypothetical protein AMJ90_02635 [candidate division Zixibacteria bacterium SM23_73_2]|nr:MAG: hypothetical protein AMJ90_02635 [candidate division Zixibacteria bacterium SM23_73_2]